MDFWFVAAAAGAGYLAKYWNSISKNGNDLCRLLSEDSYLKNPESQTCTFPFAKLARRDRFGKDVFMDRRATDVNSLDQFFTTEVASDRGLDGEKLNCDRNLLSISNLHVLFSPNGHFKDVEDGNEETLNFGENHGFLPPDSSAEGVGVPNAFRNKTSLRAKLLSGKIARPLNSIESCFMAQLYKEHEEMEKYVVCSPSSPYRYTRPFLVSDGSRIISRGNDISFSPSIGSKEYKLHEEACQVKDENVYGVPSLQEVGSLDDAKKIKFNAAGERNQRLSSSNNAFREKYIHTQHDAIFLFSLGVSFGILTSVMANKREMEELRELVNQTDNLIQDLQEELEMKDSMTVKELHNENYGSRDTFDHSCYRKELTGLSPGKRNSPRMECGESCAQMEEDGLESMSKIEAELEAELERLGLEMNASSLESKMSELVEASINLDPNFVADLAQGELRADLFKEKEFVHTKSDDDAGDITPLPGEYAVSPHELTLRLHEVAESRLEERVKELEIALENSQRTVRFMELEHEGSSKRAQSSSNGGNMLTYEACDPMVQPLILNLSGEALDAYNEAYEELINIGDCEENSPIDIHHNDHEDGSPSHDLHASGFQHSDAHDSGNCSAIDNGKLAILEEQSSSIYDLDVTEDESCSYDELETQLIRQIVERTKKGSSVFEDAQKTLYCMDEDEY
ncbi:hypothetical protein Ahy_B10g105263 [Arachis hypogaea]|uniref:Uncharacterized protein n=1 Tax=Arachis hypogaea TaxID=3818 RepID=A0A444X7J8_ARAHY|nr:hypothetical protein Ahy_B10g105263 [Arachis hypogaea]